MDRSIIQSGDLLIWSTDKKSWFSRACLSLVRFFTSSEFAHVAIAWRLEGRLYIVEATAPMVRLTPVWDEDEFYHVAADLTWSQSAEEFLLGVIGCHYSIMDSVRAYLGISVANDQKYQCAELVNLFYRHNGIDIPDDSTTPSSVVTSLLMSRSCVIRKFNPVKGVQ